MTPEISLLYVYFDYDDRTNQSVVNLAGRPLRQIFQRRGSVPDQIIALYKEHIKWATRLKRVEIVQFLHSECASAHKTFLVIDVLDESSYDDGTREVFMDIRTELPPNTRLLLNSRSDATVMGKLSDVDVFKIKATDEDIALYIQSRLEEDRRLDGQLWCSRVETDILLSFGRFW